MNIFITDPDPTQAAQWLCDKHLSKMQLETAQIVSTVLQSDCLVAKQISSVSTLPLYKATHAKHPSTVWAGQTISNFAWLLRHASAMADEWQRRGGDDRAHKSWSTVTLPVIQHYNLQHDSAPPPDSAVFCAGSYNDLLSISKVNSLGVTAHLYRSYYVLDKTRFAKYKNATPPWWLSNCDRYTVRVPGGASPGKLFLWPSSSCMQIGDAMARQIFGNGITISKL